VAGITVEDALNRSFTWALWKVLDFLSARYLPGSVLDNPQQSARGAEHQLGSHATGSAASAIDPDAMQRAMAAMAAVDPAELQAALATLGDDESPLVRSLAWAIGAPGLDAAARQYRLEASLLTLTRAEAFALLALVLYAAQQQ
jgi:hypothetical protein